MNPSACQVRTESARSGRVRVIGLDVGGTKIAVAAVTEDGQVVAQTQLPTESQRGFADGLDRIERAIENVLELAGWKAAELAGIGVGCAGPVNPFRGTIHNPFTLPGWEGAPLVAELGRRFGLPVRLENDADAALLGEFRFGAGRAADPVVMLTFGTGIGGAALVNRRILRGARGEHPELGHVSVDPDGPECYCGRRGCWESMASGTAIEQAGHKCGWADAREVCAAAEAGQEAARAILERAARATEIGAWAIIHALLPERIVLGGGLMNDQFERFAAAIRRSIERATMVPRQHMSVVRAELGNLAGLVGAASLVLNNPAPNPD